MELKNDKSRDFPEEIGARSSESRVRSSFGVRSIELNRGILGVSEKFLKLVLEPIVSLPTVSGNILNEFKKSLVGVCHAQMHMLKKGLKVFKEKDVRASKA